MRLIDADALLEAMNLLYISNTSDRASMEKLIDNIPTVQREGWVSIKDATPDYSGTQKRVRVLVYWKDTKTVFTLWYGLRFGLKKPEFYEENEWTESNDGEINESDNLYLGEYLTFKNITHWQYLPSAPKE